jgi:hypothetical protein
MLSEAAQQRRDVRLVGNALHYLPCIADDNCLMELDWIL